MNKKIFNILAAFAFVATSSVAYATPPSSNPGNPNNPINSGNPPGNSGNTPSNPVTDPATSFEVLNYQTNSATVNSVAYINDNINVPVILNSSVNVNHNEVDVTAAGNASINVAVVGANRTGPVLVKSVQENFAPVNAVLNGNASINALAVINSSLSLSNNVRSVTAIGNSVTNKIEAN